MERPPEFDDVEALGLDENEEEEELMQEIGSERLRQVLEVTVMYDGWTDRKGRTLINFLINSPKGSVFIKSIDASDESKTATLLASLIEKELMEIDPKKVVQVVTDNTSNNVAANLMLEDIFKICVSKEIFRKAVELTGFIYGSSGVLNMLRKFTNGVELLRPEQTRFATAFITLGKIHLQKANIRKMFTSKSWTTNKWAKEVKGKKCERTVLSPAFWNHVVYALKVFGHLVRVLRLVDNEKKNQLWDIFMKP
ncbi:uncharacterized protein LOC131175277 [Hevea brasiliensis]|uniref:uncharacterized protein LOC131175277 n=1 Tax=Hevea brasiliensis TaxID=3981 RepID=UPI0025F70C1B|nr:uncharacterized protein LOC131175277 [Hevea brasiliensis]